MEKKPLNYLPKTVYLNALKLKNVKIFYLKKPEMHRNGVSKNGPSHNSTSQQHNNTMSKCEYPVVDALPEKNVIFPPLPSFHADTQSINDIGDYNSIDV